MPYGTELDGQTALITGSARGLGRALVRAFLDAGARVVAWDVDEDANRAMAEETDAGGERVVPMTCDLADLDALTDRYREVRERYGAMDILVNNAARALTKPLRDITPAEWDQVFDVNLRAAFFLTREVTGDMRTRGSGRVVNLASIAGQAPRPTGAAYGAAKAGLIALGRVFAAELGPHGITVNTIAPAMIDTPMVRAVGEEVLARLTAQVPVGRIATPEEVARLAVYLAGPHAGFITGATYDINGGALMR
ncbi:SDR family NAD(P)-dependent oxidoreductase [Streptomyces luteireticuli]|uniref:3-oxoacyl-ACP reductase FabG n=1 Tax=Streptomyces luteireticuli TaxID=173858 RepID=A0ABP3IB18_9ACTN